MDNEKIINNIIKKFSSGKMNNPLGDTAWAAYKQNLLSEEQYKSLKRKHKPSTVNFQEFLEI